MKLRTSLCVGMLSLLAASSAAAEVRYHPGSACTPADSAAGSWSKGAADFTNTSGGSYYVTCPVTRPSGSTTSEALINYTGTMSEGRLVFRSGNSWTSFAGSLIGSGPFILRFLAGSPTHTPWADAGVAISGFISAGTRVNQYNHSTL